MPDLDFTIVGSEAASDGITPLIQFDIEVANRSDEHIQSIILQTKIRIETVRRSYEEHEKDRLVELFGRPEMWGRSLQSMLWTDVGLTIPGFESRTRAKLPVPVTFDLHIATAKYFYALQDGDIPLLFLFTGSIFYTTPSGSLLMQRISWDLEASYRMPVQQWKALMETHYPEKAWLYLERGVFDELYAFKQRSGLASWEAVVGKLLEGAREEAI